MLKRIFHFRISIKLVALCLLLWLAIELLYLWEPGSGVILSRYESIQAGMSKEEVSAVLRSEPDKDIVGATVWSFSKWNRPYHIIVAWDENGRVAWKRIRIGAFRKLGYWIFN